MCVVNIIFSSNKFLQFIPSVKRQVPFFITREHFAVLKLYTYYMPFCVKMEYSILNELIYKR